MKEEASELVEALRMKIEALQIKNEALLIRIEALEMGVRPMPQEQSHLQGTYRALSARAEMAQNGHYSDSDEAEMNGKRRKSRPDPQVIKKLYGPLDEALHEILNDPKFNRATYRALTGILLCLYENTTATVSMLHEYIGGARVTIVRHTAMLKKLDLLRYEGSRKKGHYVMTDRTRALFEKLREKAEV